MLVLFLLQPAHAERGWFQRTFGAVDNDDDGVPDRRDDCPTMAETVNGYEDDDGCPDYLSFVTVQARYGARDLTFAEYWMEEGGKRFVANGTAMTLDSLIPGTEVDVAARYKCLGGQGRVVAGTDPVGVRLKLYPEREHVVSLVVTDSHGRPVEDVSLQWVDSYPSACAPVEKKQRLPMGKGTATLGLGAHTYRVNADGLVFVGTIDVDTQPLAFTLPITLKDKNDRMRSRRLPEVVYFDSGRFTIRPDAMAILEDTARKLLAEPELGVITIEGHADQQASTRYNEQLGQQRAEAVHDVLVSKGVPTERLMIASQGEEEPAMTGTGPTVNARNRRVEFLVEDPSE